MWHAAMLCCQEDIGASRQECRSGSPSVPMEEVGGLFDYMTTLKSMMHCIALNRPDRYFQSPACVSESMPGT
jgi:hypothetical protein